MSWVDKYKWVAKWRKRQFRQEFETPVGDLVVHDPISIGSSVSVFKEVLADDGRMLYFPTEVEAKEAAFEHARQRLAKTCELVGMTVVDAAILKTLISVVGQAIDRSIDGCEGGWHSEQVSKLSYEIDKARDAEDWSGAWAMCLQWLRDEFQSP